MNPTCLPTLPLGQLFLEIGAADEAAGVLLSGMKHQPENGSLRFSSGTAHLMRGDLNGAKEQQQR